MIPYSSETCKIGKRKLYQISKLQEDDEHDGRNSITHCLWNCKIVQTFQQTIWQNSLYLSVRSLESFHSKVLFYGNNQKYEQIFMFKMFAAVFF